MQRYLKEEIILKYKLVSVYPTARIFERVDCVGDSAGKVNDVKQRRKLCLEAFGFHRNNTLSI